MAQKWSTVDKQPSYRALIWKGLLDFLFPQSAFENKLANLSSADIRNMVEASVSREEKPWSAALFYRTPFVRKLIWTLKYKGNTDAARLCGELLYECMLDDAVEILQFSKDREQKIILVPIPLSRQRLQERGFNQCDLVCKKVMQCDEGQVFLMHPQALMRKRHTQSQTVQKDKTARIKNMKNAFVANRSLVSNAIVFLVDDVVTTGTTLHEAAKTLRAAGARKVRCYAIAH